MHEFKKIICIDFDGVIHGYSRGWQKGRIYDEPVPGSMEFLLSMISDNRFKVAIYSSRSKTPDLLKDMRDWLFDELFVASSYPTREMFYEEVFYKIFFPIKKPAAWLTIDDRAICFTGSFPSLDEIDGFTPWNKKQ